MQILQAFILQDLQDLELNLATLIAILLFLTSSDQSHQTMDKDLGIGTEKYELACSVALLDNR